MPVVAGVDSSTQSCTVELRDADSGELLGGGRAPHPPTRPPRSEQAADAWWHALRVAFGSAIAAARCDPADIRAISVAAQCHGLVLVGAGGAPLREVKLWNDTTSAPQAARIVADWGVENWVRAVGSLPTSAFTISKLAWIADHEPALLEQAVGVMVPHDYLTFRLTGRRVTDRSDASGTGYYASHESRWRADLLERYVSATVDWNTVLPDVLAPSEVAGVIVPEVAAELGLSARVVVGPGAGDQHAGAVGLGMSDGEVAYSLGTSGVVLTPTPDPVFDPIGTVNGVSNITGGYLPLVCTSNSTKVTDTVARWLSVSLEELSSLALAAPERDRPLAFAAYLDGERSPNRPGASGVLGGLTNDTTRDDLARAAFEGVLLGLVTGHECIQRLGVATDGAVIATGGGARSPAYRQLLADLLQREVIVRDAPEASARGAAIQAAAVLSSADVGTVRDAWRPATVSGALPRPSNRRVRALYDVTAAWSGLDRSS